MADCEDAIWADLWHLYGVRHAEIVLDGYTFWRAVMVLPLADGMTTRLLQVQREAKGAQQQQPVTPANGGDTQVVPAEALNAVLGSNLISFGKG